MEISVGKPDKYGNVKASCGEAFAEGYVEDDVFYVLEMRAPLHLMVSGVKRELLKALKKSTRSRLVVPDLPVNVAPTEVYLWSTFHREQKEGKW